MIISVTNLTGGVGKSTLAVHTAAWLSEHGSRVAFIDAEPHKQSAWIQKVISDISYHSIPSDKESSADELSDRIPKLASEFDDVVIDGPVGLLQAKNAIFFLCDLLLLPCSPSALDLDGTKQTLGIVKRLKEVRLGAPGVILVPNRLRGDDKDCEFFEAVKSLKIPISPSICSRKAYADARMSETVVWRLSSSSADKASTEMRTLFETLFSKHRKPPASASDLVH